jgi:hypothetical protein
MPPVTAHQAIAAVARKIAQAGSTILNVFMQIGRNSTKESLPRHTPSLEEDFAALINRAVMLGSVTGV